MNQPNFKPIYSRIVIQEIKEEKTKGGIIYQEAEPATRKGKVIAAGDGKNPKTGVIIPMEVKVGDTILYQGHVAEQKDKQVIDGITYYMMNEEDVLAVIE